MAEATSIFAEQTTEQSVTGTTWTTKLQTTLAANTTYMILVLAYLRANVESANNVNGRVMINSVAQDASDLVQWSESNGSTFFNTFAYLDKYTTGGSTEDIEFQIKSITGETCYAETITIFALDLSYGTENVDWFFAEDDDIASPTAHTTSFVGRASKTWTPGNSGDDWLILGWGHYLGGTDYVRCEQLLDLDSGTSQVPFCSHSFSAAEEMPILLSRVYNLDNSSHTIELQSRDAESAAHDHEISRLFGIRLNAFKQHVSVWNEAEITPAAGGWAEAADLAVTPQVAGNWFLFGTAVADQNGFHYGRLRFQIGGTTHPTGIDSHYLAKSIETAHEAPMAIMTRESLSTSAQDIDADGGVNNSSATVEDRSFVAFSLELAGASYSESITLGTVGSYTLAVDLTAAGAVTLGTGVDIAYTNIATVYNSVTLSSTAGFAAAGGAWILDTISLGSTNSIVTTRTLTIPTAITLAVLSNAGSSNVCTLEAAISLAMATGTTHGEELAGQPEESISLGVQVSMSVEVGGFFIQDETADSWSTQGEQADSWGIQDEQSGNWE